MDVLLATFNGERYLEEQLESLARQEDVNLRVWANDDGSVDQTLTILDTWHAKGLINRITNTVGVGSTQAFLKLLSDHSDSQYVAFCDQDDIWEPRKLATQVIEMKNEMPMCIITQKLHIDSSGAAIGKSKRLRKKPSFENSMIENVASGNTILINNLAINLINKIPKPQVQHYDSWIYLLVSLFGKVVEIPIPLTNYRIHSNNSVGLRRISLRENWISIKSFINQNVFLYQNIVDNHNCKKIQKLKMFQMLRVETNLVKKFRLIQRIGFKRQRLIDQFIVILLILFLKNSK